MNKEEVAILISEMVQRKDNFHQKIGELVLSVEDSTNSSELANLVEGQGTKISPSTLRQYAWMVRRTKELGIPSDIDFSTKRQIIGSKNRDKYIDLINQGYTVAQIKRELAIDNKQSKTSHTGYCKDCSAEVDVKKHDCKSEKEV
jgi:hypothetical protein